MHILHNWHASITQQLFTTNCNEINELVVVSASQQKATTLLLSQLSVVNKESAILEQVKVRNLRENWLTQSHLENGH